MDFAEINKFARLAFSTKEMAKSCVETFARSAIEEEKKKIKGGDNWIDSWLEYYSVRVKDYSSSAVDIIFKHAESEIETLFLGTLLLAYLRSNPMGLIFKGPLKNVNKDLKGLRDDINNSLAYWNMFASSIVKCNTWDSNKESAILDDYVKNLCSSYRS